MLKTTVCITCAVAGILISIGARSDPNPETKNTVASQYYVDTMDATKQNKIPATGTNSGTPGNTVVTYTGTAGTIGERGIYSGDTTYNSNNDSNKLVTANVASAGTFAPLTAPTCVARGGVCSVDTDCCGYDTCKYGMCGFWGGSDR